MALRVRLFRRTKVPRLHQGSRFARWCRDSRVHVSSFPAAESAD